MKNRNAWITTCLINLAVVAALGFSLRTKFLFPIPFLDYRNLISTHSHFAFAGWVTLTLMILYIEVFLAPAQQQKRYYQVILWGILLTSYGMLLSFPFQGYGLVSIVFSTLFIFFTYAFTWVFLRDAWRNQPPVPLRWLTASAMASLVISSAGPFWLAYMMASHSGNATNMRDAVYTYLHFQYNGFFTLSVFALYFQHSWHRIELPVQRSLRRFVIPLCISVLPSLFLSLLWHYYNFYLRTFAVIGCMLIVITLFFFMRMIGRKSTLFKSNNRMATVLLILSVTSFILKMLLQTATIIPWLGNAAFGFRPIIIGFLHLVFLGLVTFYILSHFISANILPVKNRLTNFAVSWFAVSALFNEVILMVDGAGRLAGFTYRIYDQLLWLASIGLFSGAVFIAVARVRNLR